MDLQIKTMPPDLIMPTTRRGAKSISAECVTPFNNESKRKIHQSVSDEHWKLDKKTFYEEEEDDDDICYFDDGKDESSEEDNIRRGNDDILGLSDNGVPIVRVLRVDVNTPSKRRKK